MDKRIELALFAVIVFVSSLAAAFLFRKSGFLGTDFVSLTSLGAVFGTFVTLKFALLVLVLPFVFGLVSALSHFKARADVYAVALGGAVPAMLISLALFGSGFAHSALAFFFLLGLVCCIEVTFLRKEELKRFVTFRASSEAAKKAFFLVSIGLFIAGASAALEDNEANVKRLGDTIIELSFNPQASSGSGGDLASVSADLLIGAQKQTISALMALPQYKKLESKQDAEVQEFVAAVNAMRAGADDPGVRQKVVEQLREKQGAVRESFDFDFLRRQSPLIAMIAEYYWLIHAFALATMFTFVANILLVNMAGLYAAGVRMVMGLMHSGQQ